MQTATVTKELNGTELVDMEALADAGAAGFTDDGIPIMDEHVLVTAMKKAVELDLPISLHEEDPEFIIRPGVNQGKVSDQLGYGGASATAEDVMVARDCMLALNTGASVCIQHISSGNSVELVRLAKKLGADIHAEATPHHFTLTEDAVLKYGTNARMNPPLRTENDREKIIEGIKDGTIDMIVTDHAPHSEEEKAKPLENAPSGITGLETSLALGIKSLVEPGHISLMKLIELMSKNPAEFYRMVPGSITKGASADIVIFGEKDLWTVNREDFASKACNSPFIGWELPAVGGYRVDRLAVSAAEIVVVVRLKTVNAVAVKVREADYVRRQRIVGVVSLGGRPEVDIVGVQTILVHERGYLVRLRLLDLALHHVVLLGGICARGLDFGIVNAQQLG